MKAACCGRNSEQPQAKTHPSGGCPGPRKKRKGGYSVRSRHSYADREHGRCQTPADGGDNRKAHTQGPAHTRHIKQADAGGVKQTVSTNQRQHHAPISVIEPRKADARFRKYSSAIRGYEHLAPKPPQ